MAVHRLLQVRLVDAVLEAVERGQAAIAAQAVVQADPDGYTVYIAGGSTSGDAPVAKVYRARIDSTGVLGPWQAEPDLPFPRSYVAAGQLAGLAVAASVLELPAATT